MSNPFKVNGMGAPRIWTPGDAALPKSEIIPGETGQFRNLCGELPRLASGVLCRSPEDVMHAPSGRGTGGAPSVTSVPEILKTEANRLKLCMAIAMADSEEEVEQKLRHYGLLDNMDLWRYYGDKENNWGVAGNQQAKPEAALAEKLTNAIDAVNVGACWRDGKHPLGKGAPHSITEAVRDFFGVRDGDLSNLSPAERTALADHIMLVATGRKTSPCLSIIDKGEGQSPGAIPKTFLSLNVTNKKGIPFVHGRFNMGATGALPFCGEKNFQLIISRRDPIICEQRDEDDSWGFTIVRRIDPPDENENSTYVYLTINGTDVPSFSGATPLPLLPGDYPTAMSGELEHGTFIKLYDYKIGPKLRQNIVRNLTSRLSTLIPGAALPILVLERRHGYDDRTEATLSGLTVRLAEDRNRIIEPSFPASLGITVDGHRLGGRIYAFTGDVAKDYVDGEGILFTIKGQTNGALPRTFFSRKAVDMSILDRSLLAVIDASQLSGRAREDLFLASRDRLRNGPLRTAIEEELERVIRTHQGLKDLKNARRRKVVKDTVGDDKPLRTVLQKVLFMSPVLSQILIRGERLTDPFKVGEIEPQEEVPLYEFPKTFQLVRKYPPEKPKRVSPGGRAKLEFFANAHNDYFDRDRDPGSYEVYINGERAENATMFPWQGITTLTLPMPKNTPVGSRLECEVVVSDIHRADPFHETFHIKVVSKDEFGGGGGGQRDKDKQPTDKPGKGGIGQARFKLPEIHEVHEGDWGLHGFDKYSVARVVRSEEQLDVFLNMDNIYLLTLLKRKEKVDPEILKSQWQTAMALNVLGAIKRYDELQSSGESDEEQSLEVYVDEVLRSIAPVELEKIEHLGSMHVPE